MIVALDLPPWFDRTYLYYAIAVLAVLAIIGRVRRWRQARRPIQLHPKLAKYGEGGGLTEAEQAAARRIIATSSTAALAGYELARQIEAVFVDGARSPEEAVLRLKAIAGQRGANAIVNLSQHRTAAGRCAAQGDAVVVRGK